MGGQRRSFGLAHRALCQARSVVTAPSAPPTASGAAMNCGGAADGGEDGDGDKDLSSNFKLAALFVK